MSIGSIILGAVIRMPKAETRGIKIIKDIKITMSDGINLVADLYMPNLGQKAPTILVRTPYGKKGILSGVIYGRLFAERGFNVLIQCVRGTFGSEGDLNLLVNEESDGRDTVEWIKKQSWFSGDLATMGASYLGYCQWAIAANYGKFLKAINISISTSSFYKQFYMGDSVAFQSHLGWSYMMKDAKKSKMVLFANSERLLKKKNLSMHLPLENADKKLTGRRIELWREMIDNSELPYSYWKKTDHSRKIPAIKSRVNMITGWYDIFLPWNLNDYEKLKKAGNQPYLTIGPWAHTSIPLILEDIRQALHWTRYGITGDKKGIREMPVRINIMGSREWREFPEWPPKSSKKEKWHLRTGKLSMDVPVKSQPDKYTYDPLNPTPNLGGALMNPKWGPKDNRKLEAREDVLTYTSDVLTDDYLIIGNVEAELYVKSGSAHTDFFVRLCDVLLNGKSMNVCDGLQRIRPKKYQKDKSGMYKVAIRLWPTAYCFKKGHCLRVQVSSGAHPRYVRNTGSGESIASAIRLMPSNQEIFHDSKYKSAIILPAMK
jgi:putative CocE/NonD family hydrolase